MRGLLLALLFALPAQADVGRLPALFSVTGVAANDTLNVRRLPRGTSAAIGALAPGETDIEVVRLSESGEWGLLNIGESAGWAAMRFLARQPGQSDDQPPTITACYGAEPSWGLNLTDNTFSTPMEEIFITPPVIRAAGGRREPWGLIAQTEHGMIQGILSRQVCSDGMSDRENGLQLDLIFKGEEIYTGCCLLAPISSGQ